MKNRIRPHASIALPFLLATTTQAVPFLIFQDRSVCAQDICTQSQTAGTFNATRSASGASATQHSNLSSCGIYAWLRAAGAQVGGFTGSSRTTCNLAFGVSEPSEFTLSFQSDVNTFTPKSAACYFTLSADDTVIISAAGELTDTWSGTLTPGVQYLLQFFARGQAGGPSAFIITRAQVIIQVTPICPIPEVVCLADQSTNGVVDLDDLSVVVQNWNRSVSFGTSGDTNRDGRVNLADIGRIVAAWGEPCIPQP